MCFQKYSTITIVRLFFFLIIAFQVNAQNTVKNEVDIVIIGGGAGGTTAAIQAARMGVNVLIIEHSPWLGGMLSTAGVSAIDGNHEMPSGLWGEFRNNLYRYYGGKENVATGWVSHTLFEPHVANKILKEMTNIPGLRIAFNARYKKVLKSESGWIISYEQDKKNKTVETKILIDATETGDILPLVKADFRLGMDSREDTGEKQAPETENKIVQDITSVVILEDIGSENMTKKGLLKKPNNYDPKEFSCCCTKKADGIFQEIGDCQQMLNYGKLPNNKYMINWPNCGNDFYLNWPELTKNEYEFKINEAKEYSLRFVYFIQNDLGFKNLRIANEFPTSDQMPFILYHREGRRVKGKVFLTTNHLENPYNYNLYKTGIAVGDYPIDHHHKKNPSAPEIDFINIEIPSYSIPLGTLIPQEVENFIVAEKNISVSNIVNGTTRLQPVVLGIGQAAGTIAAISVKRNKTPSKVSVREVQNELIQSKAYLLPFIDVKSEDSAFAAIQRVGVTGILKGYGIPYKWANQTWFYPNQIVSEFEWKTGLVPYYNEIEKVHASGKGVTIKFILEIIKIIHPEISTEDIEKNWVEWGIDQNFQENVEFNRKTISVLTDKILNPFDIEIDLQGNFH